jgi:hypothetical protein
LIPSGAGRGKPEGGGQELILAIVESILVRQYVAGRSRSCGRLCANGKQRSRRAGVGGNHPSTSSLMRTSITDALCHQHCLQKNAATPACRVDGSWSKSACFFWPYNRNHASRFFSLGVLIPFEPRTGGRPRVELTVYRANVFAHPPFVSSIRGRGVSGPIVTGKSCQCFQAPRLLENSCHPT